MDYFLLLEPQNSLVGLVAAPTNLPKPPNLDLLGQLDWRVTGPGPGLVKPSNYDPIDPYHH